MKKKLWIMLTLLIAIPGLMLFTSCAKKTVTTEPSAVTQPSEEAAEEKAAEVAEVAEKVPTEEEQAQEVARQVTEEEEEPAKKVPEEVSSVMGEQITEEEVVLAAVGEKEETIPKELIKEPEVIEDEEAKLEEIAERNRFIYEDLYFEFDKSNLLPMAQATLKRKAEYLFKHPSITVVIEGHCDERGTNEYNLALGDRRGESAKRFLVDLGIPPSRLTTISYGEERPVDPRHNKEAWAKNRRAHFAIE